MPIFEYRCSACGHAFELLVRTAAERVVCPRCDSTELVKQFSLVAAPRGAEGGPGEGSGGCCGTGGDCGCSS